MTGINAWTRITSITTPLALVGDINPDTTPVTKSILWSDAIKSEAADRAVYDVKQYAATGDGETNDATAIQAALDAMPAGGGTLHFPPGEYALGAVLDVEKPIRFVCQSGTVVFRSAVSYMFRPKASHVSFTGFTFKRTGAQAVNVIARDVTLANALHNIDWKFIDCEFNNTSMYFEKLAEGGIETGSDIASFVRIVRCYFHDITGANYGVYFGGVTDFMVDGCHFDTIGDSAVGAGSAVKAAGGSNGYRITNNYIYNTYRQGIDLYDSTGGIVANNRVDTSQTGAGIDIKGGGSVEHVQIIGNYVTNCTAAGMSGISVQTNRCSIVGNRVVTCTNGIRFGPEGLNTASQGSIVGNSVSGCNYGIYMQCDRVSCTGNDVLTSAVDGIYCKGSYNSIIGNVVHGSASDDIEINTDDGTNFTHGNVTEDGTPKRPNPGTLYIAADTAVVFGALATDGSWRIVRSGDDLKIERRESGNYVTKSTIAAS